MIEPNRTAHYLRVDAEEAIHGAPRCDNPVWTRFHCVDLDTFRCAWCGIELVPRDIEMWRRFTAPKPEPQRPR